MSRRCISFFFCIGLLAPVYCQAQFGTLRQEYSFLDHLAHEKLFKERLYVLNHLSDSASTHSYLERAWTFHALNEYDSALKIYDQVQLDSILTYQFHSNYLSLLFKANKLNELSLKISTSPIKDNIEEKYRTSLNLMDLRYSVDLGGFELPDNINKAYKDYFKSAKKSPALAGLYSAIIPGLGKAYIGKKKQAWNMFIVNAVLGLQAYESYKKAGITSTRFFIFGGLFSFFYVSNIYGTIIGTNKAKRDNKQQLHYEIIQHYYQDSTDHPAAY